jgi:glycosyltransferase involved in cell wall biosynthesis
MIIQVRKLRQYYKNKYNADSCHISYGAEQHSGENTSVYEELGIKDKQYLLVVARLERDNNVDLIVAEYTRSSATMPLVVVGDAPYDQAYLSLLHDLADKRVRFVGRINDQAKLNSLYRGAYLYIHGHEVGGTNPSLLRAMHAGAAPVIIDVDFNRAVTADSSFVFTKCYGDLSALIDKLIIQPDQVRRISESAHARTKSHFTWSRVVEAHAQLFSRLVKR